MFWTATSQAATMKNNLNDFFTLWVKADRTLRGTPPPVGLPTYESSLAVDELFLFGLIVPCHIIEGRRWSVIGYTPETDMLGFDATSPIVRPIPKDNCLPTDDWELSFPSLTTTVAGYTAVFTPLEDSLSFDGTLVHYTVLLVSPTGTQQPLKLVVGKQMLPPINVHDLFTENPLK